CVGKRLHVLSRSAVWPDGLEQSAQGSGGRRTVSDIGARAEYGKRIAGNGSITSPSSGCSSRWSQCGGMTISGFFAASAIDTIEKTPGFQHSFSVFWFWLLMSFGLSRGKELVTKGFGIELADLPPLEAGRIDPREWFDHPEHRFEIEIGTGKGTFLLQQAKLKPQVNYL